MTQPTGRCLILLALACALAVPAAAEWTKGTQAFQAKDWATAAREFEEVTQTNPDYAGAYYMLGLSQSNMGKLSQALASLRRAVELDGSQTSYRVALGQALLQAKQYGDAFSTLKAVSLDSMDQSHRSGYALVFAQAATRSGNPSEAVRVLNAQLRADSRNARLHQALGVAYDDLDDQPKAYAAFKRAFELDPTQEGVGRSAVYAAISMARRSNSDQEKARLYSEAAGMAEKLASAEPSFEHNLLAGEAWLGAKEYQRALTWFDKAQRQQAQNALVHYYRAQCYTSTGQLDSAMTELQQALRLRPDDRLRRQIYNQMGFVLDKQKKYDEAIRIYREIGATAKVAEMEQKQELAAQNLQAAAECEEFRRRIEALRLQITELEKLGDTEQVQPLREQLPGLEQAYRERCR